MKIVELDQRSDDWHQWRAQGIGASEAPCLLKKGYKTPYQLWEEKCGYQDPPSFMNRAMEHGINAEPIALQWANSHCSANCSPICAEDEDLPFIRASLDGWDPEERILMEIKCPSSERILDHARAGLVREQWVIQVQWQIMVARPQKAYIVVWDYRTQIAMIIEQYANEEMILDLRKKARKFWEQVRLASPPALSEKDYKKVEAEELRPLLDEYWKAHKEKKAAEEKMSALKESIKVFGDGERFDAYGFKVSPTGTKRRYNTEQMRLDGIDIDRYAKEYGNPCSWTIRVPKNW